jgi:fucose permease
MTSASRNRWAELGILAVALAEANIAASLASTLGPLLIGGFQRAGLSWRLGLVTAIALMPLAVLIFRRVRVPGLAARLAPSAAARLPGRYWGYWALVWLVVSVEWCLIVWSPDFFEKVVGIPRELAAAAVFVFYLAQLTGRITGSLLARRYSGRTVLLLSLALSAAGFPLFWLARAPALNVIGLFVAGFGVANLFPFTMAAALATAPGSTDLAASRVSLAAGAAIFSSPLLLAWLADRVGINAAYAIVPLLLVLALVALLLSSRQGKTAVLPAAPRG